MTLEVVKTKSHSQELFESFIDGAVLPMSACDRVMNDLGDVLNPDYQNVVAYVQHYLRADSVVSCSDVTFVNFRFCDKDTELPVLVRFLNLTHCKGHNFIVVNNSDLVYFPNGCKKNNSINELVEYVSNVQKAHLKQLKKKETVDKVKAMFTFAKATA